MQNNALENEDYFGFHSEYYVDPKWEENVVLGTFNSEYEYLLRGYMKYSYFREHIFWLEENGSVIVKCNPSTDETSAIRLKTKKEYNYIAVNCRGYFLYSKQDVALYDFDGNLVHEQKYASKKTYESNTMPCVYVYDSGFYYTETKSYYEYAIIRIDMLEKKSDILWKSEKDDSELDYKFSEEYMHTYNKEMPFRTKISNIKKVGCEFLYVNKKRVIARFVKGYDNKGVTYIINLDLQDRTLSWDIIECNVLKGIQQHSSLPSVFSFDMEKDVMWVKLDEKNDNTRLFQYHICKHSQLAGKINVEWEIPPLIGDARYYYFDGEIAYMQQRLELSKINKNADLSGTARDYQTLTFYCLDGWRHVPNEYQSIEFWKDGKIYNLTHHACMDIVNDAKEPQKIVTNSVNTAIMDSIDFCSVMQGDAFEISKSVEIRNEHLNTANSQNECTTASITLQQFREQASYKTGFRDELLAYRKSLSNSWDYNAYVGILLGIAERSASKKDAQSNYAVGQGDNGKNATMTIDARGLMPVYEKYKGKNIDSSIMLSAVEDEIIAIVPEYDAIRKKLHEVAFDVSEKRR